MPKVQKLSHIDKEDRKKLYMGLKKYRGAITELSNNRECSLEWTRMVLTGRYDDYELLLEASRLLKSKEEALIKASLAVKNAIDTLPA